ncbi:hypothetical protein BB561_000380 [Smittium simulii]|uniref:Interferon-related developmental regulator N-terminal domain-containing protein n=1 Tax=Smittium simulii TaxID=133385 RepID=A0A2T9YZB3_9FUNG|nr:hypothetical protein BB561_000380 [Smittium simulii]
MSSEGTDLIRLALSNYSGLTSTPKLDDSVSAADKIKEGLKKPKEGRGGRNPKSGSVVNSRANSREQKTVGSRINSRIQSRVNSSERIEKNSHNQNYSDSDSDFDKLADSTSNIILNDQEDNLSAEKKISSYAEQLGKFSQEQLVDTLNSLLDKLTLKRVEKREEGLQGICSIMVHKYIGEFEERNKESYLESFKKSLRIQKTTKEALLATRGIALWFLQFGYEEDDTYNDVFNFLTKIMQETHSASLHAQIIHTIAFANFIGSSDYVNAVKVIEICSKQIREWKSEELTLLATSSYGLMMTIVAEANIDLAIELFEKDYECHLNMLESQSVNVRIKSAENLALLYELISEHDEDFEFDNHMEVIEMLEQMSKDSTKRHSKKDRFTQKSALRQVVNSIANNSSPQVRLSLQTQYLSFSTWKDIIKLEAFKFTVMNGIVVVDSRSELAKYRSRNKNVMRQARSKFNMQQEDSD